jgi:polyhydroxybutyrate depolymerase
VQERQLLVGGLTRSYRLYTPLSIVAHKPVPLVLVLGGVGNSPDSMVQATGLDMTADANGFIAAYPAGVNQTWNGGYCCLLGAPSGPDDVAFLTKVIDDVESVRTIDAKRVYVVGVSAGAIMAYTLGCQLADRIAGIGSVAGAMILDTCHPTEAVSVIEIHGTADGEVPYQGGATDGGATMPSPPTVDVVSRWAQLDGCPNPPTSQTAGIVGTQSWTGCQNGTAVKLITITGGGHTWFSSVYGPVDGAVDATQQIWTFLSSTTRTS